jgi:uncharacterized membrane protein
MVRLEMDASQPVTITLALSSALSLLAGALLGFTHFLTLRHVAQLFADGRTIAALGIQLARMLVIGGALLVAAWLGALPLLACAGGMLLGRMLVLRRERLAP